MPDHFDELDDDQRARLCVLTQLYEELGELQTRDLLQFAHWVVIGDDPSQAWRYTGQLHPAGTTTEITSEPCTEPTSAEDDVTNPLNAAYLRYGEAENLTEATERAGETASPQFYDSGRWHPAVK